MASDARAVGQQHTAAIRANVETQDRMRAYVDRIVSGPLDAPRATSAEPEFGLLNRRLQTPPFDESCNRGPRRELSDQRSLLGPLEQLDRVAVGVFQLDLPAAGTLLDLVAEAQARLLQLFDA